MSKHMPLVGSKLSPLGLTSWKVLKFPDEADYCVQATLEWKSMDDFQKAGAAPEMGEVMEDVKNFSDKQPTLLPGDVVGTS